TAWIPFVEWGYLILVATLVQAALLGALLIALPLVLLRRGLQPNDSTPARSPSGQHARLWVLVYFLALGLGYLFVEMALIQRLVFFLANPIYSVAVVLAGLLLVSGLVRCGAARQFRKWPLTAVLGWSRLHWRLCWRWAQGWPQCWLARRHAMSSRRWWRASGRSNRPQGPPGINFRYQQPQRAVALILRLPIQLPRGDILADFFRHRSEEHTSELQSR